MKYIVVLIVLLFFSCNSRKSNKNEYCVTFEYVLLDTIVKNKHEPLTKGYIYKWVTNGTIVDFNTGKNIIQASLISLHKDSVSNYKDKIQGVLLPNPFKGLDGKEHGINSK